MAGRSACSWSASRAARRRCCRPRRSTKISSACTSSCPSTPSREPCHPPSHKSDGGNMRGVITGASRGIGRATAVKLAADGVQALSLCDVAYLAELAALAVELRTAGCKVKTLRADMAKPKEPARVIDIAAKAMGGIDAIVGNAGITAPSKLVDLEV